MFVFSPNERVPGAETNFIFLQFFYTGKKLESYNLELF